MVEKDVSLGGFNAIKVEKNRWNNLCFFTNAGFFIADLRREPIISTIMVLSLIICALGFYIERRKNEK